MKRNLIFFAILVSLLLLTACQASSSQIPTLTPTSTPLPTPTPTPSPQDYLNQAAEAMAVVDTLQFSLTHQGEPLMIDETLGLQFVQADGAYQAPDQAGKPSQVYAAVSVDYRGNLLQVDMLWLTSGNYMSNPLSGVYGPMPEGFPLNPLALFDNQAGIPAILRSSIQNPQDLGMETIAVTAGDLSARRIDGVAQAQAFVSILPGAAEETVAVRLWLDPAAWRLARVEVEEVGGDVTRLDIFAYGEAVTIPTP